MSNFDKEFLNTLTIPELKYICKLYNARVKGFSTMSKEQLVNVVSTLATFEYNKDNLPIKIVKKPKQPKQPKQKKQPKSVYSDLEVPEYTPYKSKYDAEYEDIIKQYQQQRQPKPQSQQYKPKSKELIIPEYIEMEVEEIMDKIEELESEKNYKEVKTIFKNNLPITQAQSNKYIKYLAKLEKELNNLGAVSEIKYMALERELNNNLSVSDKKDIQDNITTYKKLYKIIEGMLKFVFDAIRNIPSQISEDIPDKPKSRRQSMVSEKIEKPKQYENVYRELEVPEYTPYKSKYDAEYEDIIKQYEYKPQSRRQSIAPEKPKKKVIRGDIIKPRIIEQEPEQIIETTTNNFDYINDINVYSLYGLMEEIKDQDIYKKIEKLIKKKKKISQEEALRYREYLNELELSLMELKDKPQDVFNKLTDDLANIKMSSEDKKYYREYQFSLREILNNIDDFIKDIDVMRGDLYMIS
jgi:hypothetical protein